MMEGSVGDDEKDNKEVVEDGSGNRAPVFYLMAAVKRRDADGIAGTFWVRLQAKDRDEMRQKLADPRAVSFCVGDQDFITFSIPMMAEHLKCSCEDLEIQGWAILDTKPLIQKKSIEIKIKGKLQFNDE